MNAETPQEPSVPSVPPGPPPPMAPPQMAPPQMSQPQPGSPHLAAAPGPPPQMGQPQFAGQPPMLLPRPPSDRPSPIGLAVAGVGLALLCISMLLPRIKIDDPDGEFSYYSLSGIFGASSGYGIDTSTVVLSVALLAAVGLSAHRSPALRWPARLGAIGTAALLAAFTYHPVTVLRQSIDSFESYEESGYEDDVSSSAVQIDITADSGVYLAVIAAVLLALSAFLMQASTRRNDQFPAMPHMQPPPPGNNPTVSVSPG